MSDKIRTSRLKVYCPRCEEAYIPKQKSVNIDGAFYGASLPHIFMKTYPDAIVLPPKVYYYEPKIYGFRVFGKRGSKYYRPAKGPIKYTEDEEDPEELIK